MNISRNIGWQYVTSTDPGNNFDDGAIEVFRTGKWASLAREVIQNSMDAIREEENVLKMSIKLENIPVDDIPDKTTIVNHIKGTLSINGLPDIPKRFSESALKILNKNSINVLKISDYNTKGVLNSDDVYNNSSKWRALIYDEGNSQKDSGNAAGSRGLGKNASFALSDVNMVFYVTKDMYGKYAMEGVAKLNTSFINGKRYEKKVYYGVRENDKIKPLLYNDCTQLSKIFDRNEIGTDVIIIGVNYDLDIMKKEMIQSVIENFFVKIQKNELDINILGENINKDTLNVMIEKYCKDPIQYNSSNIKYGYIKQYLNTYSGIYNVKDYREDVTGVGKLRLIISKDSEINGKWVAMFRTNGMKIMDLNIRTAQQNFSAIFFPDDENVDKFLRSIENATHDSFDADTTIKDYDERILAKERYKKIENWIRYKVEEYTKIDIRNQDYLDGMEEYIQLEDSEVDNSVVRNPDIEIIEYSSRPLNADTMIENMTGRDDEGIASFTSDDGESTIKNDFTGTSNFEPGDEVYGYVRDEHNKFGIYPKIMSYGKNMKIAFSLDDYNYVYFNMEILAVGEDNTTSDYMPLIIKAFDLNDNTELNVVKNIIYNVPVHNTNVIMIEFERNFEAKYKICVFREEMR